MNILNVPFCIADWKDLDPVEYQGERGTSWWRTFEKGNIRVRMVEYSPEFVSDHYCSRGHVLLVLEGTLRIRLRSGDEYEIKPGMSFQAGDDANNPHLAYTDEGALAFVVD